MTIRLGNGAKAWQTGDNSESKWNCFCEAMRQNNVGFTDADFFIWSGDTPKMLLEISKYNYVGTPDELSIYLMEIDTRRRRDHNDQSSIILADRIGIPAELVLYLKDVHQNDDSVVLYRSLKDHAWFRTTAKEKLDWLHQLSRG